MIIYTLIDYLKLQKICHLRKNVNLEEQEEKYKYSKTKTHQIKDKIFRDILNDKEEVAKLINQYLKPEKMIKKEMIEKYETSYITSKYENRNADIVYKMKEKDVFFLIEHQTKVDKLMAYRILEYSLEIIKSRMQNNKEEIKKFGLTRVIPIVIYTGQAKWSSGKGLNEIQIGFKHLSGVNVITGYNLIDIRNKEKAIEDDSFISKIIILERMKNTEEILDTIDKIAGKVKDIEDKKRLAKIVRYLLEDRLNQKEIKKVTNKLLNQEEGEEIMHVHEVLRRDREKARKEGKIEGKIEGIMKVAQKMLEENIDVELISKITGLKKEEFMK